MGDFLICTDGGSDLSPDALSRYGVISFDLSLSFGDGYIKGSDMTPKRFYERMRQGDAAKTSATSPEDFYIGFERALKGGKDILYIGLSSGLSTTYNSARVAAKRLNALYPDRKIALVDSRCASGGLGLVIHLTAEQKAKGKSLAECKDFAKAISESICHLFTVDDLSYLRRGGRISAAKAIMGNALGVKPILHVTPDGHLVGGNKARGRRGSLDEMARLFGMLAEDHRTNEIFITHADCHADALYLAGKLSDSYGAKVKEIFDIGAVIGAHAGPGTVALFFVGEKRP